MYWGRGVDIPGWQHLLLLKVRGVRRPGGVFLKVFRRAINDIEEYDECNSKEAGATEISPKIPPTWFDNTLDEGIYNHKSAAYVRQTTKITVLCLSRGNWGTLGSSSLLQNHLTMFDF